MYPQKGALKTNKNIKKTKKWGKLRCLAPRTPRRKERTRRENSIN